MARFVCRCRRWILLCMCTPCIVVGCVIMYITLAVCLTMTTSVSPMDPNSPVLPDYFVATGVSNSGPVAPYPVNPFWNLQVNKDAFWNKIQHILDRQHNPILRPRKVVSSNLSTEDTNLERNMTECLPNYNMNWTMSNFSTLPSQMQRFVISMHCRSYSLLIDQPQLCGHMLSHKGIPMLLLAIKSQAPNFENRQAIRETWGRTGWIKGRVGRGGIVRRVFLLGKPEEDHDPVTEKRLQQEVEKYRDIIRWNFLDTFFNLTLKDILFWDWFTKNCPYARYVFKGDDDVFVRMPALLDYIKNEEKIHSQSPALRRKMKEIVVGDVITSAVPLRLKDNKYFIPDNFYKGMYPSYAGGGGVVYSGSLVHRLLQVSKRVHLFPIDDVYLGMCLQRLGVIPVHHPAFLTFDFPKEEANDTCAHHTILLVHKRSPVEMLKLWKETLTPIPQCRNATLRVEHPEKQTNKQSDKQTNKMSEKQTNNQPEKQSNKVKKVVKLKLSRPDKTSDRLMEV